MQELRLQIASAEDAEVLTEISKRAFDSDVNYGAPGPGGPPGYDSLQWQKSLMKQASVYLKMLLGERIVGGIIVFHRRRGNYYLGRMFLDPDFHRQGLGLQAVEMLFERYPEASRWTLDTPVWNTRTHGFYQKLGFKVYKEKDGLLYFEKLIS